MSYNNIMNDISRSLLSHGHIEERCRLRRVRNCQVLCEQNYPDYRSHWIYGKSSGGEITTKLWRSECHISIDTHQKRSRSQCSQGAVFQVCGKFI